MANGDSVPEGKTAEEYLAEAARPEPARGSRSRSRTTRAGAAASTPAPEPAKAEQEEAPRKLTPKFSRLREGVEGIYTAAQMGAMLIDPDTAAIIGATKGDCVDAWIDLAEKDPKVAAMLTKMTTGVGWGGIVMAHMPMVIPILAKRGWIPGGALFDGALMNRVSAQDRADEEAYHAAEYAQRRAAEQFAATGVVTV